MLKIGHEVTFPGKKLGDLPLTIPIAQELETVPGIPTNQREVDWYSREYPLETYHINQRAAQDWSSQLRRTEPEMTLTRQEHVRIDRALFQACRASGDLEPTAEPTGEDVSQRIKDEARRLGSVQVGITSFDYRYVFASRKEFVKFPHAVCLAYEQDFENSQTIPSHEGEIAHDGTSRNLSNLALKLADYIRSLGYHAQVIHSSDDVAAVIAMFVDAGVGQMGACGYLLTPHAGNRARLTVIATDAEVTYDQPVDFGIHAFCQICQVCVNRCPGRALMRDKIWWRGIEKNKLYYRRCRPVMARYFGCGVCVKVCPIQKYGMATVLSYYAETGQVLGKGTHDLEGYTLPDKGYFGPGEMPVFERTFFSDMPYGSRLEWAFEKLKEQVAGQGHQFSDGLLEELKMELARSFAAGSDINPYAEKDENQDNV